MHRILARENRIGLRAGRNQNRPRRKSQPRIFVPHAVAIVVLLRYGDAPRAT